MMTPDEILDAAEVHLNDQHDVELILLKGHLILEQCINLLLQPYIKEKSGLEKLGLSFSKKLDLLSALGIEAPNPHFDFIKHLREINRLRNKLAHQLTSSINDTLLDNWACEVIGRRPKTLNRITTRRNTIVSAFTILSAYIAGVGEAYLLSKVSGYVGSKIKRKSK